jgi:uncharacterized membrane protein
MNRSPALQQAEIAIAWVLRGGVALAGALIALGLFARLLSGEAPPILSPLSGLHGLGPDSLMTLGLLVLIALPVVRVAMTVILFVVERDYIYLAITGFVLFVLLFGLFFGNAL